MLLASSSSSSPTSLAVYVTLPSSNTEFLGNSIIVEGGDGTGGYDSFLGIQYATVGERFSRSTLVEYDNDGNNDNDGGSNNIKNIINATEYGYDCHQMYSGLPEFIHESTKRDVSEECLYLNIWRPHNNKNTGSDGSDDVNEEPLSTMVWIHGGGFAIGSGSDSIHNGANMAVNQNVIVITLNYRLGVFGLLPQDEITGYGGMNSLYDQIQALQWIHNNIDAFGGSSDKITVFGESAGSESICMLNVSPLLTQGLLYQRAILQSGECVNNYWSHGIPTTVEYGFNMTQQLLVATGTSSIDELADPNVYTADELNMIPLELGWPIVTLDTEILPKHPSELYKKDSSNNVVPDDIMIGSNSYEDVMLMGIIPPDTYVEMANNIEYTIPSSMEPYFGGEDSFAEVSQGLIEAYNPEKFFDNDHVLALARFNADFHIGCPTYQYAMDLCVKSDDDKNVYLYEFAHYSALTDPAAHFGYNSLFTTDTWASHLAEIPFVFGTLEFASVESNNMVDPLDKQLHLEIQTKWANFAKTGNPNDPGTDSSSDEYWHPVTSNEDGSTIPMKFLFSDGVGRSTVKNTEQCDAFPFVVGDDEATGSSFDSVDGDDEADSSSPPLTLEWTAVLLGGTMVSMVASISFW